MELTGAQKRDKDKFFSQVKQFATDAVADLVEEKVNKRAEEWEGEPKAGNFAEFFSQLRKGDKAITFESSPGVRNVARSMLAQGVAEESLGKANFMSAEDFAAKTWGDDSAVELGLVSDVSESGGSLLAPTTHNEVIDKLRPNVVVMDLIGDRVLPMPSGSMRVPTITSDPTAAYVGEAEDIETSQGGTGLVTMQARKLVASVVVSNDLIRRARVASAVAHIESWIEKQAIRTMSLKQDRVFLRSKGGDAMPKGLRHWAKNTFPATGGADLAAILSNLANLWNALEDADVPMTNPAYVFHPRIRNFLMFQALDGQDRPFFLEMLARGELMGAPYRTTTSMPKNLGAGGNRTEIIFADFDRVIYADTLAMETEASRSAAYNQGGKLVSAHSRDQTVLRVISEHDLAVEHEDAVAVLEDVSWGL